MKIRSLVGLIGISSLVIGNNTSPLLAQEVLPFSIAEIPKAHFVEIAIGFPQPKTDDFEQPDKLIKSKPSESESPDPLDKSSPSRAMVVDALTAHTSPLQAPSSFANQKEISNISFQLRYLKLDPSGNNALFLGRTEAEGADFNNLGFLSKKNPLNDTTRWVFIDSEDRKPKSLNDIVIRTDKFVDLIDSKTIPDRFLNQFKVIVIDSGAAEYILTTALLDLLISWVSNNSDSMLIFENLPPKIYPACPMPSGSFSLPLEERMRRWQDGEPIKINDIIPTSLKTKLLNFGKNPDTVRAYPKYGDVFSQIIIHPEHCDDTTIAAFTALLPALRNYFEEEQKKKMLQKLETHFDKVKLKKNNNSHNNAPFVRDQTTYPATNFFWWIASHKKDTIKRPGKYVEEQLDKGYFRGGRE